MIDNNDAEIIKRILSGDTDAFEILVSENQKRVYNLAYRMVRNEDDALDLSQEAFFKAFRSLSQFRGDSSFAVWMYKLTKNVCIDFIRKKKKQNVISLVYTDEDNENEEIDIADNSQSPEVLYEQTEIRCAVSQGLKKLSEEHRQILTLRELDGYSYEEIASLLSLEMGTVKSRIARARLALRTELESGGNFFSASSSNKRKGS